MKRITFIMVFAAAITNIMSQNYHISFAGQGASASVDSVLIENLTQNTFLKIGGEDTLQLIGPVGLNDLEGKYPQMLNIYPNPFTDFCFIEFESPVSGNAVISLCDGYGKQISKTKAYLQQGINKYQLSQLNGGVFYIHISSEAFSLYGKLINNSNDEKGIAKYTCQNIGFETPEKAQNAGSDKTGESKGIKSLIQMQYNIDDILKITGISDAAGNFRTVYMLIPTSSQTITFNFVACTDPDGANYAVVEIGDQVWMAENMKYLPSVVGSMTGSETTPCYYVYNYDGTNILEAKMTINYNTYGVLYNWPAAMAGKAGSGENPGKVQGVCPTGWHLPGDADWSQLTNYLGGANYAGYKLKETGLIHWNNPNNGATNETGYTALPGGYRGNDGWFYSIGMAAHWWSSTELNPNNAWYRFILHNFLYVGSNTISKDHGFSVRCLRD